VNAPDRDSVCGICGQHDHGRAGDTAERPGRRIEYVVIGTRGELAHYQATGNPSKTFRTVAAGLAAQLGVPEPELVGSRFSYWVEPAEYGVIRSDFRPLR
jgi:hypothetical protein